MTHGSFTLNINWDRTYPDIDLSRAKVIFLDENKKLLANGVLSNGRTPYLQLIHPNVGNCYDKGGIENAILKTKSWKDCRNHISKWIPTWATKIKYITLVHEYCMINEKKLVLYINRPSMLLFFYIYNPRGSLEMPETSYTSSIKLNNDECQETI